MRRKELTAVNIFLIALVILFSGLTVSLSINESIPSLFASLFKGGPKQAQQRIQQDQITRCSKKSPLNLAAVGENPYLTKLNEYQQVCHSYVTNQLMVFTGFPTSVDTAEADGLTFAKQLLTLHQAGISPIVIAEPYSDNGAVSYREFMGGAYDRALDIYFKKLHDAGVTDQMIGMWVPFPESNTPEWNNKDTEPSDFATCVNKYLTVMKKYFPNTRGSILLSATTYDPTDTEYNNGEYRDLAPYTQDINKDLVTSVGIEGFPWVSKASVKRREIFNASDFLQPDLAIAAARELHTRDIWFNTGSFATKYTNDKDNLMTVSTTDRKAILSSILDTVNQVQNYEQNGYRVSINLFSEDKSAATEATDWSYFKSDDSKTILKDFLVRADDLGLPVALYDKTK